MVYLKGLVFLLQNNVSKAVESLKGTLTDEEQEDNASIYFFARYISGNPDIENYEKFMKNYYTGPLYLQFAGACTKGEWDKARTIYKAMEKEAVFDSGIALIFPVIKKIIEKYPENFKFLQETH